MENVPHFLSMPRHVPYRHVPMCLLVPFTPCYQMVIWWQAAKVEVGSEHSESVFKIISSRLSDRFDVEYDRRVMDLARVFALNTG